MVDCRPGTALFASAVLLGSIALALRSLARVEVAPTPDGPAAPLLGARVRVWYRGVTGPAIDFLERAGVHADAITYAQLVLSVWSAMAFWTGCIFLGGVWVLIAGTLDVMDGDLARRGGSAGPRGALIDSVVDRWAEAITFFGVGAYFRHEWVVLVVILAAVSSQMVSYVRARAEGLGVDLHMGSLQRPERYVLLGFGACGSGLVSHLVCAITGQHHDAVLVIALVLLAALSTWTVIERMRHAVAALGRSGTES